MNTLLRKLQNLENKTVQYGNRIHFIKQAKLDETTGKITLITNLETYTRPLDSAPDFLTQFIEVSSVNALVPVTNENQQKQALETEDSAANELIDILKANIQKVQENAAYIPQAKSINNDVNSIINIAKVKIETRRSLNGRR